MTIPEDEPTPDPTPWDVFTPRAPAGELMFINRTKDKLGERLEHALNELGAQIIVYGDTGVGKTSLVARIGGDRVARVECQDAKSFRDLLLDAFGALGVVQELRFAETHEKASEAGAEMSGGLGYIASLKARLSTKVGEKATREFEVTQQPLIDVLIEAMVDAGKHILFFDNFENIKDEGVRRSIAELMVALSDRARESGNVKIVLAGIAESATDLLHLSDSAARRAAEVSAGTMSPREIAEIVTRGMGLLGIAIGPDEVELIARLSAGYPYVAHLISLYAALGASDAGKEVTPAVLEEAIAKAVDDFHLDFSTRYRRAVEQSGGVRPRRRILHALAESDLADFDFDEALAAVKAKYGGETAYTYFNAAIGALCTENHGSLLRKRSLRGKNRYSFQNPLARAFIRLIDASSSP